MSTVDVSAAKQESSNKIGIISDSLAFGVVFTIVMTVVQRLVGFGRGILFCRYMTDQELGQWSIIFSFLMLLAPLAVLGLPGSFGRFAEHYLQKGQIGTFVRRLAQISCLLTVGLATSMYIMPAWYARVIFGSAGCAALVNTMAFALVMVAASNFLISLVESLRQVRLATLMRFVQGVSFALLSIAMMATWQDPANAATFSFGVACFLTSLPACWFLWKHRLTLTDRGERLSQKEMWIRIAPFAIWLWASNFVCNMFEVSDRYMLIHWAECSVESAQAMVGQYHSARVVPMLLVGVAVVLEGMFLPYMTALWEQQKREDAATQTSLSIKLVAIGFTLTSLVVLIGSPVLFDHILSGKYNDGFEVLGITLLFSTWFSLFMFVQIYLWVAEKGKLVFALTTFGLIANLGLNAALIPILGLWGAVTATTVSTLICLALALISNNWIGNAIDRSVWLACLVPLIVVLPIHFAIASTAVIVLLSTRTNLLFSRMEKQIAFNGLAKIQRKLGLG